MTGRKHTERLTHSGGYVLVYAPDHPLAKASHPHVYEHRKVFYDANGIGPFACHECGDGVTWETMHVDHLDDDKAHNDIGNLAASCAICNQARGKHKAAAASKARGHHVTAFGITLCANEWAAETGIPRTTLMRRISEGWTPEEALWIPPGPSGRKAIHTTA